MNWEGVAHNGRTDFNKYRINMNSVLEPMQRSNKMEKGTKLDVINNYKKWHSL